MNLEIKIKDLTFKNPVWVASGTFGYGEEFTDFFDVSEVGALITKTITLAEREGNPGQRLFETASGLLNSIGLENKGVEQFKKKQYPFLKKLKTKIIISVAGTCEREFVECVDKVCEQNMPDAIELNLSCPNINYAGGRYCLIAQDAKNVEKIVSAVRKITTKLLIAKLTPNVTDISEIALSAESAGADAVSLVNTYFGMAVDAENMKPVLGNVIGGVSGPAIKPMALKAVLDVYKRINIPIIGIGGIMTGTDVAEFMLCGASSVQVGTANFTAPNAYMRILEEFKAYLERKNIKNPKDIVGRLRSGN